MAKMRFTLDTNLPKDELDIATKLLPENLCPAGAKLIMSRAEINDKRFKGEIQNLINASKSAKAHNRKLRNEYYLYSASMVFLFIYKIGSYSELTDKEKEIISEECFNYVKPRVIYLG